MSGYVTKSKRIEQLQILADERATERDEAVGHLNHCRGLLETAEAQRDEANLKAIQRADALEAAEADRDRLADTLRMLWAHYLLPITDAQKAQVRAALATPDTPPDYREDDLSDRECAR